MTRPVAIRPARVEEAAGIVQVMRDSFEQDRLDTTIYGCNGVAVYVQDQLEAPAALADRRYTVAFETQVLGCAELSLRRSGLFLSYIGISETHRGRGIGRALLAAALKQAAGWPAATLQLDVFSDNVAARSWYERMGMTAEHERELWRLDLPAAVASAAGLAIAGWPQAVASYERFGFAAFHLFDAGASYEVGMLGDRWFRVNDPLLLDRPQTLALLSEVDPGRQLLATAPAGARMREHFPGALRIASLLRLSAPLARLRPCSG